MLLLVEFVHTGRQHVKRKTKVTFSNWPRILSFPKPAQLLGIPVGTETGLEVSALGKGAVCWPSTDGTGAPKPIGRKRMWSPGGFCLLGVGLGLHCLIHPGTQDQRQWMPLGKIFLNQPHLISCSDRKQEIKHFKNESDPFNLCWKKAIIVYRTEKVKKNHNKKDENNYKPLYTSLGNIYFSVFLWL